MRSGDTIFLDQYSHASIVDGAILAKSKTIFFRHNNPLDLERKIAREKGKKLVVVEGVYSMDGDMCALPEIVEVTKRHGARMLIDEAHSTFLFGPTAAGFPSTSASTRRWTSTSARSRRAWAGRAASWPGRRSSSTTSRPSRARASSPATSPRSSPRAPRRAADRRLRAGLRAKMWSNVAFLRRRFAEEGVDIGKSNSQVMPVMVNNDSKVLAVAEKIQDGPLPESRDLPRRPKHKSRLRISVSAAHTEEDLETATQAIAGVLREEGICR